MKQIRRGVFETNSSSTHSLTIGELSEEQKEDAYKFQSISLRPVVFGYADIVAPSGFSNASPQMYKLCGDCKYFECEKDNYGDRYDTDCTNPEYGEMTGDDSYKWWNSHYDEKCPKYINAMTVAMSDIVKNQSPDDRASALLPCIINYCLNPSEMIKNYFDKLFAICDKVYYRSAEFTKEKNSKIYWDKETKGWGTYDSICWMETHESLLETSDVESVLNSNESVKSYLFGNGSYAMGDRVG